ncbi:hypothetical protein [Alteribacillus sp. YIM 98480]|nr:hypothetical protein [Alteribacillus sp. YIM 98480]
MSGLFIIFEEKIGRGIYNKVPFRDFGYLPPILIIVIGILSTINKQEW